MEVRALVPIWVTTPKVITVDYEQSAVYINLRQFKGNVQETFSELELKVYGEILNQMQKIYTQTPPPVLAKDNIYFAKPEAIGTTEIDGVLYDTYLPGVAVAEKPKSQYLGVSKPTNPTYTNIKFEAVSA